MSNMAETNTMENNPLEGTHIPLEGIERKEFPRDPNVFPSGTDVPSESTGTIQVPPAPIEELKASPEPSGGNFSAGYNFGKPDSPAQEIVTAKQAGKPIA